MSQCRVTCNMAPICNIVPTDAWEWGWRVGVDTALLFTMATPRSVVSMTAARLFTPLHVCNS